MQYRLQSRRKHAGPFHLCTASIALGAPGVRRPTLAYQNPAPSPAYSKQAQRSSRQSYILHPKEYEQADRGPFWGSLAAVIGGFLIATYGVFLAFLPAVSSLAYQFLIGGSLSAAGAGWLLFLSGLLIVFMGFFSFGSLYNRADGALIWVLLLVLGLTVTGYGFYFASLLAVSGAAHIFWWKPSQVGGPGAIRRALGGG
jgi:hypothetical protein